MKPGGIGAGDTSSGQNLRKCQSGCKAKAESCSLMPVSKLKDQGIYVQFESENIHTESMYSELILSILGGLAEEESKSISLNSKWSMKRRFETGAFKHTSAPYGYDYKDGGLIPNAVEAVIVERIFREYLAGQGTPKIAEGLNGDSIPSRKGRAWSSTVVRKILSNEACTGDVLLQKTYTDDQYNRHYNQGQRTQYLVGNHHEAIISQEVFDAAQTLLCRRGKGEGASGKYHQRYPLSGKMKCAHCGSTFKRRIQRSRTGPYIIWACTCHLQDKALCPVKPVRGEAIEAAFVTLINKLIFGHKTVLKPLLQKLRSMNQTKHQERFQALEQQMAENQKQRNTLEELLGKCIIEKPIYNQESSRLLREAEHLKVKRQTLAKALLNGVSFPLEVEQLLKFAEKAEPREGFEEDLLERFVEGIVIHSTTELAFHLRCGLVLNERMVK